MGSYPLHAIIKRLQSCMRFLVAGSRGQLRPEVDVPGSAYRGGASAHEESVRLRHFRFLFAVALWEPHVKSPFFSASNMYDKRPHIHWIVWQRPWWRKKAFTQKDRKDSIKKKKTKKKRKEEKLIYIIQNKNNENVLRIWLRLSLRCERSHKT